MSSNNVRGRLVRIERYLKPASCRACYGKPSRVVTIDPVTGEELGANMPATGCPVCGQGVVREYHLVADDADVAAGRSR